jgi:hypothetical protein
LYDALCSGVLYSTDAFENYQVILELSCDDDIFQLIENFSDVVKDDASDPSKINYNSTEGTLQSPQLESILSQLFSEVDGVLVFDMSYQKEFIGHNFINCPLGNSCFSYDKEKSFYIEDFELYGDKISAFWNFANCITILNETQVDNNDSIYDDFDTRLYSRSNISFEVESITGLNPLNLSRENLNNEFFYGNNGSGPSKYRNDSGNDNNGGGSSHSPK